MQIVINIDESLLDGIKSDDFDFARRVVKDFQATIADAIKNGTVLPKHGRLVDADALENYIKKDADEWDEYALAYFENAPTIIEADKESEDKE